jgi:excisionase family DNA binding protein
MITILILRLDSPPIIPCRPTVVDAGRLIGAVTLRAKLQCICYPTEILQLSITGYNRTKVPTENQRSANGTQTAPNHIICHNHCILRAKHNQADAGEAAVTEHTPTQTADSVAPADVLLTAKEAAAYLRVSVNTLGRMEQRGLIVPYRTMGGHRRYSLAMLRTYLEGTRVRPHGEPPNA